MKTITKRKYLSRQSLLRYINHLENENKKLLGLVPIIDENVNLHIKANQILKSIFGVDIAEKIRTENHRTGRQFFCKYFYDKRNTYVKISELLNKSTDIKDNVCQLDHSTVINCLRRFEDYYGVDKNYQKLYESFKLQLEKTNEP